LASYLSFKVGAVECAAVSAGLGHFRAQAFFADVPPEALRAVLAHHGIDTEKIPTPFNCLLIRHREALVLVDTGTKPRTLVRNLRQQGIEPEDIGWVVLSHAHADHMGGALDEQDAPTFPNARYVVSRTEYENAQTRLAPLSPQLIEAETELLDGIRALAAPGHTLGQIAIKLESEGETLLYTADVIAHPIHLEHCNWNIISDADRALALRTRANLLGDAADNGWCLFVYHFPFPGLCRIARAGDCWRITEQPTASGG
jgi:glyoxylase-like metal-dependent hydrolase (beta-lactamase superfamily II)